MDHDNSSSFARYFVDGSLTIRDGETREKDAILWMTFDPISLKVNLSVYDGAKQSYTHTFKGSTPKDVSTFIADVCEDYNVFIPTRFIGLPKKFVKLSEDAFSVNVNLTDEFSECDSCGDTNSNNVQAFYFPAISDYHTASLSVHWNYGCFGGSAQYGNFVDTKTGVLDILSDAVAATDDPDVVQELTTFIGKVEAVAFLLELEAQ